MNQITELFKESNARMKRLMKAIEGSNKPDMDVIAASQRECEAQLKAFNIVIQAFAVAAKNKRAMKGYDNMNLLNDYTAIDLGLGDPEVDKVKCPDMKKIITMGECLDYSGTHVDQCSGCEIGIATKDKLIPVKP